MIEIRQDNGRIHLAMESEKAPLRNDVRVGTGRMGRSLKGEQGERLQSKNIHGSLTNRKKLV